MGSSPTLDAETLLYVYKEQVGQACCGELSLRRKLKVEGAISSAIRGWASRKVDPGYLAVVGLQSLTGPWRVTTNKG